jgi:hypothetical protein
MSNQRKVQVSNVEDILGLDDAESFISEDSIEEEVETPVQETPEKEVDIQIDQSPKTIEDLDDEEVLWEDGPTAGMIKDWKTSYNEVYVTSITYDKHIVWRVLNRNEYKQIVKKMEQLIQGGQLTSAEANMWNEETISELCILFPKYDKKALSGAMAGMPSLIAQEVLEASGFVALEVRQL